MALQLILGSSGQGKTEYLMEEVIRESMDNPSRNYYLLVPEQFSLEMQRQMVMKHPRRGFSNIDILSFYRLAYRVFDECAYEPKEILEDLGVSMMLKKILMDHEEELTYFRRSMRNPGFLDELKSMLMEFVNYGITASEVESVSDELSTYKGLSDKCMELSRIFGWFTETVSEHYMIAGQILDVLKDMVPDSSMLKEGIFYLDGYTGFTPVQLKFLGQLLQHARDVIVTVTIPYMPGGNRKYPKEELFSFGEKTIYSLLDLCRDSQIEMKDPIFVQRERAIRYGDHEELAHLECNLFRNEVEVFQEEPTCIQAAVCQNPEEEAEFVLRKIEELVRSRGYRYRDFAILMGNDSDYPSAFLRRSCNLSIPLFVDNKQKMNYHSGVETVRSLFHLAQMDYSYASVFRYLKSGMSDFIGEDTDYLENYIIYAGVRGHSMWSQPFRRRLGGMSEEILVRLEEMRLRLMEETASFCQGMKRKDTTVREKITLFYETLCQLRFPEKLKEKAWEAEQASDFVKAKGYQIFFEELLSLMDKIVDIFGEDFMEVDELAQIVDAGLETMSLAAPPLGMDQVVLGDLKRTRLPDIKVLFYVGVNDGDLPPVPEDGGILNDEEKRILDEHGVTLSLNLTEQVLEDEYYMYLAFAKPQDMLILSYCQTAADGSAKRPSSLFGFFHKIYPKLRILRYPEEHRKYYFSEADSREYLLSCIRDCYEGRQTEDKAYHALLKYWKERHPEELREIYRKLSQGVDFLPLSEEIVSELYGKELIGSVTRIEGFATCPYRYYCTFGLSMEKRKEHEIQPLDIGNLFHGALEFFSNQVREQGYHWKNIPEEVEEALLDRSVDAVMDDNLRDVFDSSARNQYKRTMIKRILKRTVQVLKYHLRNSSFEPDHFELRFSPVDQVETTKIPLSQGRRMALQGVIDRVDICEEEDKLYLKIIDYKSGGKKFDFNELYHGLQMQLLVYLNTALEIYSKEKEKTVEPAGILYYHIQDPIQKEEEGQGEKRYKAFRMSGYLNEDPHILELVEQVEGSFESFSLRRTKSGAPYKNSSVMSTEDFQRVGDYVKSSIRKIGERIYSGEISATPYKYNGKTGCDYCPYRSVCGFEEGSPNYHYNSIWKENDQDILKKIREEVD